MSFFRKLREGFDRVRALGRAALFVEDWRREKAAELSIRYAFTTAEIEALLREAGDDEELVERVLLFALRAHVAPRKLLREAIALRAAEQS